MKRHLDRLEKIRQSCGRARTRGLDDEIIASFLETDRDLARAIADAARVRENLEATHAKWFAMEEAALCKMLQEHLLNFYPAGGINPYVPLAGAGPWIITTHGAVIHDTGGYGMLGMGHAPSNVETMSASICCNAVLVANV